MEVIVALSIMAVGFASLMQLFSGSIQSIEMSGEYLKGITLANHKIGELELEDFETDQFSGKFEDEEDYRWELEVEPYETPLNNEDLNIAVFKVKLRVFWTARNRERNVELATLKILGKTYPATNGVLLGTDTSGIYGNVGGRGIVSGFGNASSETAPPGESEAEEPVPGANVSGNTFPLSDISGLRTNQPQISGG